MLTSSLIPLQTLLNPSALQVVWFGLIAVLWIGFFFLEGFDFGVSMLYPVLGKDPKERRVMINTIGPVWDGNEVWLLTAGGATFAAYPGWYATLFSALYVPLCLVLVGLIFRGIAFEYRAKMPDDRWRNSFDACASVGSLVVSLVLGIGFANFVKGLTVAPDASAPFGHPNLYTGGFWALFNPFGLLGGVLFILLFCTHGAMFLALKTYGSIKDKTVAFVHKLAPITVLVMLVFVVCANVFYGADKNPYEGALASVLMWVIGILAVLLLAVGGYAQRAGRNGWAFIGTGASIVMLFVMIFVKIFGTLGFISSDMQNPLNMVNASSSPLTLKLMTIFACCLVPIVLAYQAWTYWVFHKRISTKEMPAKEFEENVAEVVV